MFRLAGFLERRLIESYSPAEIGRTLRQLAELQPGRALWRCSVIMSLPAGFGRDYFYIIMAKARELLQLKRFDGSRNLLQAILEEAQSGAGPQGQTAAKLARLIGWEQLLADLLQLLHNWPKLGATSSRAPSSWSTARSTLLNVCEWDHLSELERRWSQVDLAALLATVCRELVNKGNNRKMSRDLWNAVIPMFLLTGQQKRSAVGGSSAVQRDSPHGIMSRTQLTQFIQKVHEHTSLSVLTSLLTRLHNILLDDSTREMSLEHAVLWPTVVNDPNLFSIKNVSECLQTLLTQGIRLYPCHIPWLQAMADLRYAGNEPTSSLRYYLEACLVSSEYFTRPVPRTVLSEAVLRRMIKCCSTLHCYSAGETRGSCCGA
ncbi:integrator complex subunit 8-like [Pollicipes pollicipes]|uniref:integrator complex subunit 8-like n=1 Tax=Pollicipes pollicipes TaxID=41117 RepID=UPI001884D63F|nr:integrator complex subunit 8-like [Pollicipes pollicipes]